MNDVRLHRDAVDAFCAGRLDRSAEATLALQVARVYMCEPILPNATVAQIGRISRHLGGQDAVLRWLGEFEGEPRFVAAMVDLVDLLGALSGNAQVLAGLRQVRIRPEFFRFATAWAPTTDHVTLTDLGETAKHLLRDGRMTAAATFASDTIRLLGETLRLVGSTGADVRLAQEFLDATAGRLGQAQSELSSLDESPAAPAPRSGAATHGRRPLLGRMRRHASVS